MTADRPDNSAINAETTGQPATTHAPLPVRSYATPDTFRPQGVWRDRWFVVVEHDADLPNRCVICNRPAERLFPLIGRSKPDRGNVRTRKSPLHYGLCHLHGRFFSRPHLMSAWLANSIVLSVIIIFIGALALADSSENTSARTHWPSIVVTVVTVFWLTGIILATVLYLGRNLPPFRIRRCTDTASWLDGTGVDFRYSLPELPSKKPTVPPVPTWQRRLGMAIRNPVRFWKRGRQ